MIKYKGTTLYPPAIYDVLDNIPEIINYVVEVWTNDVGTDEITIRAGSPDITDIDGQPGPDLPLEVWCDKGGIRLVCPNLDILKRRRRKRS